MVITIKEEGKRFGARVGAIIYNEEQTKILLEKQREDRYMFPGGRIDLYEDSQTAIQRELQEELNITPSFHLRYIVELFLQSPETKYHEIGFYFTTSILESEIADVFIVLNSVCNKLNIDLYKALKDKEEENIKRTWGKE